MTTIGSVIPQTAASSTGDQAALINNYQTFLTILTTQLQHQDPMEPMDSNQFTEQLVQFSSVEQQIRSNEQLESLQSMMTASNALGVLNFVGTNVAIDGSKGYLSDLGGIDYNYNSPSTGTAEVTIRNEAGEIVANYTGVEISSGDNVYTWDGTDGSGNRMGKGTYSVQIAAEDTSGATIRLAMETTGLVTDVDLSSSQPMLMIGDQKIPTSQIKSVSATSQ